MRAASLRLGLGLGAAALLGLGHTATGSALDRSETERARAAHNRIVGFAVRCGAIGPCRQTGGWELTPPP